MLEKYWIIAWHSEYIASYNIYTVKSNGLDMKIPMFESSNNLYVSGAII